jgi:hypothetical protein
VGFPRLKTVDTLVPSTWCLQGSHERAKVPTGGGSSLVLLRRVWVFASYNRLLGLLKLQAQIKQALFELAQLTAT